MRFLGLDLGTRTLGIAVSDRTNTIASPLKTIRFKESEYTSVIPELKSIVMEKGITDFVLGLPKNMNNSLGFASERSLNFKKLLEDNFTLPVHLVDERLTTVEAENILLMSDHSRKKRKKVIDNVASSLILDTYLKGRIENERRKTNNE